MDPSDQRPENPADRALDAALARTLRPPRVPEDFRARLMMMRGVARPDEVRAQIELLELEYRSGLALLDRSYVRMRRRTLGALIGGGILIGTALPLILPRLLSVFGSRAPLVLALACAAGGLGIAWSYPAQVFIGLQPDSSVRMRQRRGV